VILIKRRFKPLYSFFGEEPPKVHTPEPEEDFVPRFSNFKDLEKAVAEKHGRRHIGWPCDEAQDLPIGSERDLHVKHCEECRRIWKESFPKLPYKEDEIYEEIDDF